MRVARQFDAVRVTGGLVGAGLGVVALVIAVGWSLFGLASTQIFERPDLILVVVLLAAVVGWSSSAKVAGGGRRRAIAFGGLAGLAFGWAGVVVTVGAAYVDGVVRGATSPFGDVLPGFVWAFYGLVITTVYLAAVGIPLGVIWGLIVRGLLGRRTRPDGPTRSAILPTAAALVLLACGAGLSQAAMTMPAGARCLDLGGERPTDGAFSPSGDRLAIVSQRDPNEPGTVRLFRWPSGELEMSWTAWVDMDVVVDPDGRVYWSAWTGQSPWTAGVMTVAMGEEPSWFAEGDEAALWQLAWTDDALRGKTSNSHHMASIDLDGAEAGRLRIDQASETVGVFWASADGATVAYSPEWSGDETTVVVDGPADRHIEVTGDPRSIALTADARTLVVASWFGGTRRYDVATGASGLVLSGSQSWIALSPDGAMAWGTEEQLGAGVACLVALDG
jgi:hypothetical protein